LRDTPQAEARESWNATVFGDGREYVDGSSSASFNDNDPSAARASSAPDANTAELSPPLVLGRCLSPRSSFPEPTVAIAELVARFGINLSPNESVVLVDFWRRGPFLDRLLAGVLAPVPVRAKSETPSSSARRGVCVPLAMLDFGESRCDVLDADFEKCDDRFPPYVDFEGALMLSLSNVFRSGVKGDEFKTGNVVVRLRGEGVKGIRPPAVRVEKSPAWNLIGVDRTSMLNYCYMISVERQINVSIDDGERVRYIERAPRDSS
jgi:hypothetical protein